MRFGSLLPRRTGIAGVCGVLASGISQATHPPFGNLVAYSESELSSDTGNKHHRRSVAYVTDVEGNLNYWERYKKMSSVLTLEANAQGTGTAQQLGLKDGCELVYGGDVVDRGSGDITVLMEIMALKRRYPHRVHIILGNRDINKLRLIAELQADMIAQPPNVYWIRDPSDGVETCGKAVERLKWILRRTMGAPDAFEHRRAELRRLGLPCTDVDVAKSFMELVCPAVLRDGHESPAAEWGGGKWVLPKHMRGLLADYLAAGQLALIIEDTLFVHGACRDENIGAGGEFGMHPFHRAKYGRDGVDFATELLGYMTKRGDVRYDLECLNRVKELEMQDYNLQRYAVLNSARGHTWAKNGSYEDSQDGSRLLQYGMGWLPNGIPNKTVVYSNYFHKDIFTGKASLLPPSREMVTALSKSGVRRVIVGHQPNGDAPLVLPSAYGMDTNGPRSSRGRGCTGEDAKKIDFEVIMADTSYANNVKWDTTAHTMAPATAHSDKTYGARLPPAPKASSRGRAVHEILIDFDKPPSGSDAIANVSTCRVHGVLSDGATHAVLTPLSSSVTEASRLLGAWLPLTEAEVKKKQQEEEEEVVVVGNRKQKQGVGKTATEDAQLPSQWVIKSYLGAPRKPDTGNTDQREGVFLVSRTRGFDVVNKYVPEKEVRRLLGLHE